MFVIETTDPEKLKRIIAAGTGGILVSLLLITINFVMPLFGPAGYSISNIVFGFFGLVFLVFSTHPTYQAVENLQEG